MVLERSTSPESCRALAPAVATAMASSHMRMRFQSPMLTTSETAPMVQNCVLLPTAPKTKASAKAPHTTMEASAAGSVEVTLGCSVSVWNAQVFRGHDENYDWIPAYFRMRRCLACSAAGLEGYFLTSARSVSRAAFACPSSDWELAILSSASGALGFSGQSLTTFCWAAIAPL